MSNAHDGKVGKQRKRRKVKLLKNGSVRVNVKVKIKKNAVNTEDRILLLLSGLSPSVHSWHSLRLYIG